MSGGDGAREAFVLLLPWALAAVAAWIIWVDVTSFIIPDGAVVAFACLGLGARLGLGGVGGDGLGASLLFTGLDVVLTGGLLLALRELWFRRYRRDGIGLGDVKLAAAGGILIGASGFAAALFAACLAALCYVFARRLRGQPLASTDRVALGALLAPAIWGVWMLQRATGASDLLAITF
jgi:prepilin signal peptidase PulO-like enzyme (type II secretory pathway)